VFGVTHSNRTCIDTIRLNWKKIESRKDSGFYTSNTYISVCIQDKNEIPTALPCFLGSVIQAKITESGNKKRPNRKKLEVENPNQGAVRISGLVVFIWDSRRPVTSSRFGPSADELLDPDNMGNNRLNFVRNMYTSRDTSG